MPLDAIRIVLPLLATILSRHGSVLEQQGRHPEAEHQYRAVLQVLGPEENERLAEALANLGESLVFSRQPNEAKQVLDRAIDIYTRLRGPDDSRTAIPHIVLALLYRSTGDSVRALPIARRAVTILRRSLADDDPSLLDATNSLGSVYLDLRQYAAAEECFRRVLRSPVKNELQGYILANLGAAQAGKGKPAEAVRTFAQALPILESAIGSSAPQLGPILNNLAYAYYRLHKFDAAEQTVRRGLAVLASDSGLWQSEYPKLLLTLAGIERAQGRKTEARRIERQARALIRNKSRP